MIHLCAQGSFDRLIFVMRYTEKEAATLNGPSLTVKCGSFDWI